MPPWLVIAFGVVAGFVVSMTLERPWWQTLLAAVVVGLVFRVGYELAVRMRRHNQTNRYDSHVAIRP
jgi:hypothetical protein